MKSKKMTAGFTLVELIVVIAILGILAGVGTVGYSGYIKKANMAADQQLVSSVANALQLQYYSDLSGDGTGYVRLSKDEVAIADGIGVAAMQAAFGDNWENTAKLSYDGWDSDGLLGNLSVETATAVVNSSYLNGHTPNELLGDVAGLTQTAYNFITEKITDPALIYSGMVGNFANSEDEFQVLCKEFGIETTVNADGDTVFADSVDNTQIANLMVFAAARNITENTPALENGGELNLTSASNLVFQYVTLYTVANSEFASAETKAAYETMNTAFKNASSVEAVTTAMNTFSGSTAYQADYEKFNDSGIGESDLTAFTKIMETVDNYSGELNPEELRQADFFTNGGVSDAFSTYVSTAKAIADGTLSGVSEGEILVAVNADGSIACSSMEALTR